VGNETMFSCLFMQAAMFGMFRKTWLLVCNIFLYGCVPSSYALCWT
jgi:hypothetical protein